MNLDALLGWWNSMTYEERMALTNALQEFHALKGSLVNRGIIEVDKNMTEIRIIKKTPEVRHLLKLLALTHAQNIKVIEPSGKTAS